MNKKGKQKKMRNVHMNPAVSCAQQLLSYRPYSYTHMY